jgi:hypothetical protein
MARQKNRGLFAAARSVWVLSPLLAAAILAGAASQTKHIHRKGQDLLIFLGAAGAVASLGTLMVRRMSQGDVSNPQTARLRQELLAHLDLLQRVDPKSRCAEADLAATAAPAELA